MPLVRSVGRLLDLHTDVTLGLETSDLVADNPALVAQDAARERERVTTTAAGRQKDNGEDNSRDPSPDAACQP
jgi:hypothetical protein